MLHTYPPATRVATGFVFRETMCLPSLVVNVCLTVANLGLQSVPPTLSLFGSGPRADGNQGL